MEFEAISILELLAMGWKSSAYETRFTLSGGGGASWT